MIAHLLLAATGIAAPQDFGDYHALVIGNNEYQHQTPLKSALRDAQELAKVLEQHYGFQVKLIEDADGRDITRALWGLRDDLEPDDNLLVYYAGHGYLDRVTGEGYWLGVDADETPADWVSNSTIITALKAIPAKHILVVSDSCFSGSLTRGISVSSSTRDYHRRMAQLRARVVLTSGGLEPVSDDGRDGHSVFAFEFLKKLRANEGVLDTTTLYNSIRRPVILAADQTPNYGDIRKCGHDGGDFLFVRRTEVEEDYVTGPAVALLLTGTIDQPEQEVATIRVQGTEIEDRVFGPGSFRLGLPEKLPRVTLERWQGDTFQASRDFDLPETDDTAIWSGQRVPKLDLGMWKLVAPAFYVEGILELPRGLDYASIEVRPNLISRQDDYEGVLRLFANSVDGAFQLILPGDAPDPQLVIRGRGLEDNVIALRFDRAEQKPRGGRDTPVLDLGRIRVSPTRSDVGLDLLRDRQQYSQLSQAQVQTLAEAAMLHWPEELEAFDLMGTQRFEAGGQAHWMSVWQHRQTQLEFVLVPGGEFEMGSAGGDGDEEPIHRISLDPFLLSRPECTQEAWMSMAADIPGLERPRFYFADKDDSYPAEMISWEEANRWCRQAGLALPTEAQWEYACRAGTTTDYGFGTRLSDSQARFARGWEEGPARVGSFSANAFGLYDMHGNVWEWCRDGNLPYSATTQPGSGLRVGSSGDRVSRGGGYYIAPAYARSANRRWYEPSGRARNLGFRPALDLPY